MLPDDPGACSEGSLSLVSVYSPLSGGGGAWHWDRQSGFALTSGISAAGVTVRLDPIAKHKSAFSACS